MTGKLEVVVLRAALVITSIDGEDTYTISVNTPDMGSIGVSIGAMEKAVTAFKAAEKVWLA